MTKKESKLEDLKNTLESLTTSKKELTKDKTNKDESHEEFKVSPVIEVKEHSKDELIPIEYHHKEELDSEKHHHKEHHHQDDAEPEEHHHYKEHRDFVPEHSDKMEVIHKPHEEVYPEHSLKEDKLHEDHHHKESAIYSESRKADLSDEHHMELPIKIK